MVQVLLTGTQIVGKAFMEAYAEAAANSAKNAASAAAARSKDAITRQTGMEVDEAVQILALPDGKDTTLPDIIKRYEQLFKLNDPTNGGSFYLQSKIVRARERIELELSQRIAKEQEQMQQQ